MSRSTAILAVLLSVAAAGCVGASAADCPCVKPEWCQPITKNYAKEVFVFSVGVATNTHWKFYDWSRITTVVLFGGRNDDMMCHAHSLGVRVVSAGAPSDTNLLDPTKRALWVQDVVTDIQQYHLDGYNLDYEHQVEQNNTILRNALTSLVKELKTALVTNVSKSAQLTMDVGYWPAAYGRYYPIVSMLPALDFYVIMEYDIGGSFYHKPIACANAPYAAASYGVQKYFDLGVPASKLVLGLPWYGYNYPCVSLDKDNVCHLTAVPFRGVNCSDAAGSQNPYQKIVQLLQNSTSGYLWDDESKSPYFNYVASDGTPHQVWYDNPTSLKIKYDWAVTHDLRGVGMWEADDLDYSDTPSAKVMRQQMWGSMPRY